jgi:hypothetical protein
MLYLVTAGKHVNNIRDIARKPLINVVEGLLEAMFSVGSATWLYSEEPRLSECVSAGTLKSMTQVIYFSYIFSSSKSHLTLDR